MPALTELLGDADPLALQAADGSYWLMREQLVASGMHTRERGDRLAGVHLAGDQSAVSRSKSMSPRATASTARSGNVADIGEPFRAQPVPFGERRAAERRCWGSRLPGRS